MIWPAQVGDPAESSRNPARQLPANGAGRPAAGDPADLLYQTFVGLVRVQTMIWNRVDGRVRAGCGVPLTHVTALEVVADTPDCRVQDLVEMLHISVGGASKAVDRLVAAGHVSRSAHPTDRRSAVLRPTAAGSRLLAQAKPLISEELARLFGEALTGQDVTELDRILGALAEHGRRNMKAVSA